MKQTDTNNSTEKLANTFLRTDILNRYKTQLSNFKKFEQSRVVPEFETEIQVNYQEIWKRHHDFLKTIQKAENEKQELLLFWKNIPLQEILIILGQRFTPGSLVDTAAIPPQDETLKKAVFQKYNPEVSVGVRAWEKHVGRNTQKFWGTITGSPSEKELKVKTLITFIFENVKWWNTFTHYKHGTMHEIRVESGHGLRWQLNPVRFIGFVEPFEEGES